MDAPTSSSLCLSPAPEEKAMDDVSTERQRPPLARDLQLADSKGRFRTSSVSTETRAMDDVSTERQRPPLARDLQLADSKGRFRTSSVSTETGMGHIPADEEWYKQERGVGRGYIKRTFYKCICNRPHTTIVCHVCGYTTTGRLRLYCPQHSNYTFLMDILRCPKCKAYPCMMRELWPRVVQEDRPGKRD